MLLLDKVLFVPSFRRKSSRTDELRGKRAPRTGYRGSPGRHTGCSSSGETAEPFRSSASPRGEPGQCTEVHSSQSLRPEQLRQAGVHHPRSPTQIPIPTGPQEPRRDDEQGKTHTYHYQYLKTTVIVSQQEQ